MSPRAANGTNDETIKPSLKKNSNTDAQLACLSLLQFIVQRSRERLEPYTEALREEDTLPHFVQV